MVKKLVKSKKPEEPKAPTYTVCVDCSTNGRFKSPKPGLFDENTFCPSCKGTGKVISE